MTQTDGLNKWINGSGSKWKISQSEKNIYIAGGGAQAKEHLPIKCKALKKMCKSQKWEK
jgi:hypothetical protein